MNRNEVRKELKTVMPGYKWTVRRGNTDAYICAIGMISSGTNRMSTLEIIRREDKAGNIRYVASSSGHRVGIEWSGTKIGTTLRRVLRTLQDDYEWKANHYSRLAEDLKSARKETTKK